MARKATRKAAATSRAAKKKATPAKRKTAARTAAKKRTARKPARKATSPRTSTARKKTAARSAATRRRRTAPKVKQPSVVASAVALVRGTMAGAVSAVANKLPWTTSDVDALTLLEQEHRRFEDLLKEGEATTERARKTRRELLKTLTSELNAHELKEEKALYPALQSHPEARGIVLEGYEEHHVADAIVRELHEVATDDEAWGAKFKVLKENIEHHIKEEEREMFRIARGILSREDLQELGARMRALAPSPGRGRKRSS